MTKRKLTLIERGLYKYAVCECCNARFVSSRLSSMRGVGTGRVYRKICERSGIDNMRGK